MKNIVLSIFIVSLLAFSQVFAQNQETTKKIPIQVNGVFPHISVVGPSDKNRSESGIGALIPWADKLWMIGYVAHIQGSGIGLYQISEDMSMQKHPESITGTFANRMIHNPSEQAIIGPHFIDSEGEVRTSLELSKHRLAATMEHLIDPTNKVYFLTMEGLFFECDVNTLEVKELFNLYNELEIPKTGYVHFKDGHTGNGRVVVANNSYDERDFLEESFAGRLAEWDGKSEKWTILERTAFIGVGGKNSSNFAGKSIYGNPIFAIGWDKKSVILKAYNDRSKEWKRYRMPKGSHSFDHAWNTEWMRIREVQTERFIMDAHGIFYELPMMTYGGFVWGIKPISYHLRIVPDFVFWRGMFVMAGDQTDHGVGQPQSGLLFQNIDDLWNYGKPSGIGAVWQNEEVDAGTVSDPYLMNGFDKKMIHFKNEGTVPVSITIEVDFLGNEEWSEYKMIQVKPGEYVPYIFPVGYSAHWVRLKSDASTKLTAQFVYN
ncbi:hypothetical protein [Algoriphagus machipongonensis]|uniref:Uncharacterized protein n=1 Tax=Algoriphagus machipongonensis TaxID=388413 RepID=A3I0B0_9BACT|nr:hypothetical protein [Algoriphagus machipongonensis]EAZ79906.1 hypothetical protein ALPR1_14794 [Algoriphagus machipongonensis]